MLLDLQNAARSLVRAPGFTALAVTLAIGITANGAVAIFSAILYQPTPQLSDSTQVVRLDIDQGRIAEYPLARPVRWAPDSPVEGSRPSVGVAAHSPAPVNVGVGEHARNEEVALVSGDYFQLLGSPIQLGESIGPKHGTPGYPARVAVISHKFWKRALGADRGVLGHPIRVAGMTLTVIGVTRPGFPSTAPNTPAVWIPLALAPNLADQHKAMTSPFIS